MKYKNKLTEIDAIFYDSYNKNEAEKFLNAHCAEYNDTLPFICWRENGMSIRAYCGEYIIKLPNGKTVTLWNEIFEELFEAEKDENDRTD